KERNMSMGAQYEKNKNAIYQQIADYCIDQILHGHWPNGEPIPSVRELAVEVGVNKNTIVNTYGFLKEKNIIVNQRGIGYSVAQDGREQAAALRKQAFVDRTLPRLVADLKLLGISTEELVSFIENYQKQQS
ncbi:MAG: GntR family transcriptional regulator, partial [Bacteroidota bacterium]